VALLDGGALIMHVVPFSAMMESEAAPQFTEVSRHPERFPPIGGGVRDSRIDFDGLLTGSNNKGLKERQRAYVMVLRSGVLEAVASSLARGPEGHFLVLPTIEAMIVEPARRYICVEPLWGATALRGLRKPGGR
jgi:hypothetical protein